MKKHSQVIAFAADPEALDKLDVNGLCRLYEHFTVGLQVADPNLCAGDQLLPVSVA